MLFSGRSNPVAMVAEIERLYFKTRRAYRVAFWATLVTVGAAAWNITDVVARVLGS
jgi:hypothetical protein